MAQRTYEGDPIDGIMKHISDRDLDEEAEKADVPQDDQYQGEVSAEYGFLIDENISKKENIHKQHANPLFGEERRDRFVVHFVPLEYAGSTSVHADKHLKSLARGRGDATRGDRLVTGDGEWMTFIMSRRIQDHDGPTKRACARRGESDG